MFRFGLNSFLILVFGLAGGSLVADDSRPIEYQVDLIEAKTHYITIEAKIPSDGETTELMLPVWTPGSYLVREYARHIDSMTARNRKGEPIEFRKTRKNRWVFETGSERYLYLKYRVYCNELSVRTNFVNNAFAVLNGAATFLTRVNHLDAPHTVCLHLPQNWTRSATALDKHSARPNIYQAKDYDELVDSPIVAGLIESFSFDAGGVTHQLVNVNDRGFWDGDRAVRDLKKVVEAHHELWGVVPYKKYLFINVIGEAGGGLEHDNCCLMLTSRWTYRDSGRYKRWLSLASHEFFHTWNIRRLRPRSLVEYDYENEVYTRSLWVAEGVTSYYEDLLLARAGFYSQGEFLGITSGGINSVENTIGRKKQSLSDSSFDAWIKFYRSDENSSNTRISYYTKGAVAALLLDAEIRLRTANKRSLDNVLRRLYRDHLVDGYSPEDVRRISSEVAGEDLSDWFETVIDSTDELDYQSLKDCFGLEIPGATSDDEDEQGKAAEDIGWIRNFTRRMMGRSRRVSGRAWYGFRSDGSGVVKVSRVEADSPATDAGLNVEDEVIAVNGYRVTSSPDRLLGRYEIGDEVELLIARKGELKTLKLKIGSRRTRFLRLSPDSDASQRQKNRLRDWLTRTTDALESREEAADAKVEEEKGIE